MKQIEKELVIDRLEWGVNYLKSLEVEGGK